MRLPPLALLLLASAGLGATAAVAAAQDVPFGSEPTTTTTTTTEPAPAADASAPVIAIRLPASRAAGRIKRIPITMVDPDTSVQYAQVDVKRRVRLSTGVVDQAYDGRRWYTTKSFTKYRLYPKVGSASVTYALTFPKALSHARYWITVKAQNDPGTSRTKSISFRVD